MVAKSNSGMMEFHLDILRQAGNWPETVEAAIRSVVKAAWAVVGRETKGDTEFCIVLTDDETVQQLNRDWRGKDIPTNVLSFPAMETGVLPPDGPYALGDVVLAQETLLREATAQSKSFRAHLSHLVLHGLLHLLGYDHKDEEEARRMETLETQILAELGFPNPYEETD